MSNGRPFRRALLDLLGPLDGAQVPGGCDRCSAYQTIRSVSAGVWVCTVHHDDDCPALAAELLEYHWPTPGTVTER